MEDLFDFTEDTPLEIVNMETGEISYTDKKEFTASELSNEQYHAREELSKSSLDLINKSPYHFKNRADFRKETKSFLIGSAFHKMVLEPESFYDEFYTDKKIIGSTKGKQFLNHEDFETVEGMTKSVMSSSASIFLRGGEAEKSFIGELEGVPVRCRPDYLLEEKRVIVDLKSCVDASEKGFASSCAKWRYYVQDAFYMDTLESMGKKMNYFLFIAVESKPPYLVGQYVLNQTDRELGQEHYKRDLEKYKYCRDNNDWYGYEEVNTVTGEKEAIRTLTLPTWVHYT